MSKHGFVEMFPQTSAGSNFRCNQCGRVVFGHDALMWAQAEECPGPFSAVAKAYQAGIDSFHEAEVARLTRERDEARAEVARLRRDRHEWKARVAVLLRDDAVVLRAAKITHERDEAVARAEKAEAVARAGYGLSKYAAAIHWDRSENTQDWMDGLREQIESVQEQWTALGIAGSASSPMRVLSTASQEQWEELCEAGGAGGAEHPVDDPDAAEKTP